MTNVVAEPLGLLEREHKASQHIVIDAPLGRVFAVVGGFYTLTDWHPLCDPPVDGVVSANTGSTIRRRNIVPSFSDEVIVEELVELSTNPNNSYYTYEYLQGPFPNKGYRSTIRCIPTNAGMSTIVQWVAVWDTLDKEAVDGGADGVNGFFATGLAEAKKLIENETNEGYAN
mmetsp:Transcript_112413/g.175555  ORF Transcript_112413/g.175555 Transcript_112413/m.175555 type:complete len:172 (-) Transcript_112413:314-829(-)